MPKEKAEGTRPNLPRRNEPRPVIRRLRAVIDASDPVQVAQWREEWGDYSRRMAEERERQDREGRTDRSNG